MKIEGDITSMNTVLQKGIKLANFTNPDQINISMIFDDQVNFIETKIIKATHKQLIQLN